MWSMCSEASHLLSLLVYSADVPEIVELPIFMLLSIEGAPFCQSFHVMRGDVSRRGMSFSFLGL